MGVNRTISESKADLKAAALTTVFSKSFDAEPTEICEDDLPLFSTLDGIDTDDIQEITPAEDTYDVRYVFDTVMVFEASCTEAEVITGRNAYLENLYSLTDTADTYPWRIEDMRHFKSHWGHVEGWFVRIQFSRYTCEDFSGS